MSLADAREHADRIFEQVPARSHRRGNAGWPAAPVDYRTRRLIYEVLGLETGRRAGQGARVPGPLTRTYDPQFPQADAGVCMALSSTLLDGAPTSRISKCRGERHDLGNRIDTRKHEFEADRCIACDLCAQGLPGRLHLHRQVCLELDKATGKAAGGELLRFAIDHQKCMFCALCTDPADRCIHGQTTTCRVTAAAT